MFNDFKTQIIKELSTAVNIKDKTNRKKVVSSLKSIKHFLKSVKPNYIKYGLIIYSGIDINNNIIFKHYFMDIPLKKGLYCCDKRFHTDFLEEYCEARNKYLIMYLTGTETFYYEKELTSMKLIKKISFERQKKQNNGGQSQARISRLRVEKIVAFANKSLDFLKIYKNFNYKSVIIAGNGTVIDNIKNKMSNQTIKVSCYNELIIKCDEFINNIDNTFGIDKVNEYMDMINQCDDKIVYGGMYIMDLVDQNLIKEILIHKKSKYFKQIKTFENKIIIKNGTREGDIFLQNYEGILGILYYKLE